MLSAFELVEFEDEVAAHFEAGRIAAPVHLSGGNEEKLIEIFQGVGPDDWVFSTWRSHYHALLKGIPREEVMRQILEGRSMFIHSRLRRFFASSIMGGTLPIACGVAAADHRVWCFVGDMCASTGAFADATNFAKWRGLDMHFVVEDNGLSTNTPTAQAWGQIGARQQVHRYSYTRTHSHYATRKGPVQPGSF